MPWSDASFAAAPQQLDALRFLSLLFNMIPVDDDLKAHFVDYHKRMRKDTSSGFSINFRNILSKSLFAKIPPGATLVLLLIHNSNLTSMFAIGLSKKEFARLLVHENKEVQVAAFGYLRSVTRWLSSCLPSSPPLSIHGAAFRNTGLDYLLLSTMQKIFPDVQFIANQISKYFPVSTVLMFLFKLMLNFCYISDPQKMMTLP